MVNEGKAILRILIFFFVLYSSFSFPQPAVPHNIGVNVHFIDPIDKVMELISNLSISYVRMDLIWNVIEPRTRGQYIFTQYDKFVSEFLKRGITPYFIFDYSNTLYDDNLSPHTDIGREAFANYAHAAVERYKGKGIIFEVYNEPNIHFWTPKPNVDDYCAMANVLLDKVKRDFPNETLVGPTTSGIDLSFIEHVIKCGVLAKFDAVTVHPYTPHPPSYDTSKKYSDLRKLMNDYGISKPIFSGEWGYNDIDKHIKTVAKQAHYATRQFVVNAYNDIALSIWYDFHDDCKNETWGECHFGLVYNDYTLKPSYNAVKTYNTLLNGYFFSQKIETLYIHFVVQYYHPERNVMAYAVWTRLMLLDDFNDFEVDPKKIKVKVGVGMCYVEYSNEGVKGDRKCGDSKGNVEVKESEGIVYLIDDNY